VNVKVVNHNADDEKLIYKATLKGDAGDLVEGCLVEVEIRLKAKTEAVLQKFQRGARFQVAINQELKQ